MKYVSVVMFKCGRMCVPCMCDTTLTNYTVYWFHTRVMEGKSLIRLLEVLVVSHRCKVVW